MKSLTVEQNRERLEALRVAAERERAHSDDGKRLSADAECQHVGRWGHYCSGRKPKHRTMVRL